MGTGTFIRSGVMIKEVISIEKNVAIGTCQIVLRDLPSEQLVGSK